MDPADAFPTNMFKWDPRAPHPSRLMEAASTLVAVQSASSGAGVGGVVMYGRLAREELEEMFQAYGVRYLTVEKIGELGFTVSTLAGMRDEELDDMMATLSHVFRWDLLIGERYGIKAAVRAERRRLDFFHMDNERRLFSPDPNALDALSQEGLSEEPVQQDKEAAGSGGEAGGGQKNKNKQQRINSTCSKRQQKKKIAQEDEEEGEEDENEERYGTGGRGERQREHPFIVTEPGEVARGKKNGLDYLFHLYDQCRNFLLQVQNLAKERGEKCPTKVTNQVFRYAKRAGASYINKPKMRHYVHCYALHCLDEEGSNALRRAFKERGENVGAWRQACYKPLVVMSARHAWDIDALFNAHPRLAIWYVPTKLRQLCHLARSTTSSTANLACSAPAGVTTDGLPPLF